MTIFRIIKEDGGYFLQSKHAVSDARLSWKAKGLLSYLYSKPNNWEPRIGDLINRSPGGKDQVYAIIKECVALHYMFRNVTRDVKGRITRITYEVYETPQPMNNVDDSSPFQESPEVDIWTHSGLQVLIYNND